MPHVELAAGVGEHGEAVEFFAAVVWVNREAIALCPLGLERLLKRLRLVFLAHVTLGPSLRCCPLGQVLYIFSVHSQRAARAGGSLPVLGTVPA